MGIHGSAGVQIHIKMISVKVVKNAYQRPYSTIPVPLARNGTVVEVIRIRHSVYITGKRFSREVLNTPGGEYKKEESP